MTPEVVGPPVSKAGFGVQIADLAQRFITPGNVAAGIGGIEAASKLQAGRDAQDIAEERAAIAEESAAIKRLNAEQVRKSTVERARIVRERGERFQARNLSSFITGNVRTNVGVPLLLEAQTRADIAKDIGFDLETGRAESGRLVSSAADDIRRAGRFRDIGKARRRRSIFEGIGAIAGRSLPFISTA